MSGIKIELNADYTLKDFRDFHFFLYYGNGITGLLNTAGLIIITLIAASILAHKVVVNDWHFKFIEIAMIAMDLYMWSVPFVIFSDTKENFGSDKFRAAGGKLVITPDSIEMTSETGNARITWETVAKVYTTGKAIYLEYSKFNAVIIPKRMLKPGEEQALKDLIREKVSLRKNR
jgi:hypothetical protein